MVQGNNCCDKNQYSGWPGSKPLPKDSKVVPVEKLSPESFWRNYVCPRKPVVLAGHLRDTTWKASDLWTNDYLVQKAGHAKVEVEQRRSSGEGYGKGRKVNMAFGKCLRRMASGDTTLYLTTQKVRVGDDGHSEVFGPPLLDLAADLPVRPSLLGNLVPQQINLWAGCAPEGSSTGLHHDYHDNLYVLLRGRKRFRLYPPSWAHRMYVHGQLATVHPNGRIVHQSQGEVLADGSDARDVALWQSKREAEAELRAAEEAARRGERGSKKRLAAAERQLDRALEAALEEELDGGGWELPEELEDSEEEDSRCEAADEGSQHVAGTAGDPDSFSKVDISRPEAQLRKEFPLFPGAAAALVCEVTAGQMLFVPAGWFHEVTSFSSPTSPTHLALNYWCHPPDNLDPGTDGFLQPYRSNYWPEVWEGRAQQYGDEGANASLRKEYEQAAPQQGVRKQMADEMGGLGADADQQEEGREENGLKRGRVEGTAWDQDHQVGPPRKVASLARHLHGLFGIGRRQFLHRFVTVRIRTSRD